MAGSPGGLTASIRRKLQDGKAPEDIVKELVAGGMTEVSAQRFVDRAVLQHQSAPPLPDAPAPVDSLDQFIQQKTAETAAANAKVGRKSLWAASALMCGGVLITGISYIMADEGERFTLMWGPVAFGFFLWGKTVIQGLANFRTFAWFSAIGSVVAPVVLTVGLLGVAIAAEPPLEESTEASNTTAPSGGGVSPASLAAPATDNAVMNLIVKFENTDQPDVQCDIAHRLVNAKGDDAVDVVDGLMEVYDDLPPAVQTCVRDTVSKLDPEVKFTAESR
jgi:hypothetical protein